MIAPRAAHHAWRTGQTGWSQEEVVSGIYDTMKNGLRGHCYHRVQDIMLAIDRYAETAWVYYLNRPYSIGGMEDKIP